MTTIWKWIKIIGAFLLMIGAAIVGTILFGGKKSEKDIDEQIKKVEAIENKTQEDLRKLEELRKKKEQIEQGIRDTAEDFGERVRENEKKPDEPKPGDAGRSADDMRDAWGN